MKKSILLVMVIGALTAGCKKKKTDGAVTPPAGSAAMGSAAAAGSGSAAVMAGGGSAAAPAKPMTGEEIAKRFDDCWGFFSAGKMDDFKTCYSADSAYDAPGMGMPPVSGRDAIVAQVQGFRSAFPDIKGDGQLVLINDHKVIAVTLVTGTNSGAMKSPAGEMPASNKKIGLYTSQVLDINDKGEATKETEIFDMGTMMGQLNPTKDHPVRAAMDKLPMPKEVVIAKGDDKEKANLASSKKMIEDGFNKHDLKVLEANFADDVMWSEQPAPADRKGKKDVLADHAGFFKAFSDIHIGATESWAAGDFVATRGATEGTNDGDWPAMKIKKTGKKVTSPFLAIQKWDAGKLKAMWIFENSMAMMQQLGLMPPDGAAAGSAATPPKK